MRDITTDTINYRDITTDTIEYIDEELCWESDYIPLGYTDYEVEALRALKIDVLYQDAIARVWYPEQYYRALEPWDNVLCDGIRHVIGCSREEWDADWDVWFNARPDVKEIFCRQLRPSQCSFPVLPSADDVWAELRECLVGVPRADLNATSVRWLLDLRLLVDGPQTVRDAIDVRGAGLVAKLREVSQRDRIGFAHVFTAMEDCPGVPLPQVRELAFRYDWLDSPTLDFSSGEERLFSECRINWHSHEYVIYAPLHTEEVLARRIDYIRSRLVRPVSVLPVPFAMVPVHVFSTSFQRRRAELMVL